MHKHFLILLLILITASCKKSTQPLNEQLKGNIELQQSYFPGVTDGYLKLTVTEADMPADYEILRDGQPVLTGSLDKTDTLLVDTSLSPNTNYTYFAQLIAENKIIDTSRTVTLTTMDTTSHDFTWQVMSFGNGGGSELNDVTIIDENNIWAVGEIHTDSTDCWNEDSTEWLSPYNAVHWNGSEWELERIPTHSSVGWVYSSINTIFAFNENDIWMFSSAGSYCYWNGNTWESQYVTERQGGINKIWGESSNNIYFVGTNGSITHYNGQQWTKLTSGTDLPIQDIWGATDPLTGEEVVLCVASDKYHDYGSKLFKIEDDEVHELNNTGLSWSLAGLWFIPGKIYYITGAGIYPSRYLNNIWKKYDISLFRYYSNAIRGNEVNNISIAGGAGFLAHYNGVTWKQYQGNELPYLSGNYYSIDIKYDIIVAVGSQSNGEILTIGRRN